MNKKALELWSECLEKAKEKKTGKDQRSKLRQQESSTE